MSGIRTQKKTSRTTAFLWQYRDIVIGTMLTTTLLFVVCNYLGGLQYQLLKSGYGVDYID